MLLVNGITVGDDYDLCSQDIMLESLIISYSEITISIVSSIMTPHSSKSDRLFWSTS
jgi:hypothetical protein